MSEQVQEKPAKKALRLPKIGESVHYWAAHPIRELAIDDRPQHAVVAAVLPDGRATLAVLSHSGIWRQLLGVGGNETPKAGHWAYPAKDKA